MNKEKIYNDFLHLNFNRITKKQKSKAREYIISSLEGMYEMKTQPKWYKILGIIPFKRCSNLESENPNYEILLTAHYDTHSWRQNYIQAFISRKIQYSNLTSLIIFCLFAILTLFLLAYILSFYFKINQKPSIIISLLVLILGIMGLPIWIVNPINPFKPATVHDDNNSGVIALIHVARLLNEKGYGNKVKLLFTDCEEKGLLGSKLFVKNNLESLQNKIIINFDCVGRGTNLFINAKNSSKLAKELQSLFLSKGINSTLFNKSFSDDRSFCKKASIQLE